MRSKTKIGVKGFFRAQVVDKVSGKIVADSGWNENTMTNLGLNNACAGMSIGATGSYAAGFMAIGKGTDAINATMTDLKSQENEYLAISPSTVATGTARATCSFDGSDNSATLTIGEIGLFKTDSAGSMIAANTFTTSQMTTDQTLNASLTTKIIRRDEAVATLLKKLLKFGENLIEMIPSQASNKIDEGVETLQGALLAVRGEEKVRTIWRHIEQGRNDLVLA